MSAVCDDSSTKAQRARHSCVEGKTIPVPAHHVYTRREPVGVAALVLPWNFPIMTGCFKLAPALAAGCTVVVKPAEQTPMTMLRVAAICEEAGVPPGVVNVLTGDGAVGAALVGHPDVKNVSFTGSTEVGRLVMTAAAPTTKRLTLELAEAPGAAYLRSLPGPVDVQARSNLAVSDDHDDLHCCATEFPV